MLISGKKLQSITQTKLTKVEFFQLLSLCSDEGYLVHKAKYYRMLDGVAMGSPLAPIVADLVMEHLLDNVVKLLPFQPSFLYKYVDDLILSIPRGSEQLTVDTFNSFHDKLQFTMEVEKDSKIPFLDMLVMRSTDGTIKIDWYRKPHKTDWYLNFRSHHRLSSKINVAMALKHRALRLSDQCFHAANMYKIKNI